ncbi:hypothetical protein [Flavobacterium sp.]|uniref:hypothetical protein n=1 Tax=Flavobacterium sp. TaxID=239 RepID=UPI0026206B6A|nr:hypothetical protein [Flavobacterium sp.]
MLNKEFGSDFHYCKEDRFLLKSPDQSVFLSKEFSLFFSGRVALYNLVKDGIEKEKWRKIYFPSYYCHEVVEYIRTLPIQVVYYNFNPFVDSVNTKVEVSDDEQNVVVNVDFYGLKKVNLEYLKRAVLIDDLTHNILGFKNSTASYCFASLRKELPVPVGGFCFSPKGYVLPVGEDNNKSEDIALNKMQAMILKRAYLEGNLRDKEEFRRLFALAEEKFEENYTNTIIPETGKQILYELDIDEILSVKSSNLKEAVKRLEDVNQIIVNMKQLDDAFGLIIECQNDKTKIKLKEFLLSKSIFPATLWPNQFVDIDTQLENRMLFIHVDYRYGQDDMILITNYIKDFFANG